MARGVFLLIASLLSISMLPATAHAAEPGCLRVDLDSFNEVQEAGAFRGYPGWERWIGLTPDRLPMTPTLLAVRGEVACDLTHGLAEFLGPRAAPLTADDARDVATLAIGALYVDVFPDPVLLPALGLAAPEPVFTRVPGGFVADVTAWTARNGIVADFRVSMTGEIAATFVAREGPVGEFRGVPDGWLLAPGMTDADVRGEVRVQATKVLIGNNADGTKWRVTYFTERYTSEAVADFHAAMHLEGAMQAYANGTAWGFRSPDPDGTLDLTLDGCDCIFAGNNANIHMFPRANDILPFVPGLAYREESETAELIVGHELFHHFQYGMMQWRHGNWLVEGMARFTETINVPDFTFLPTTLTYYPNANGMNGFLNNPSVSISGHTYDWAIAWGYLYAHNGGVAFLKAVLEESATGGTNANVDGPAVIQRAMDRIPGGHATFADAYNDFARAIFTHEGWEWGAALDGSQVHDWSTYFVPVARDSSVVGSHLANAWGIRVHDMQPTTAAGSSVGVITPIPVASVSLMTTTDGQTTFAPAQTVNLVAGVQDAALVVVRAGPPGASNFDGTYYVAIRR